MLSHSWFDKSAGLGNRGIALPAGKIGDICSPVVFLLVSDVGTLGTGRSRQPSLASAARCETRLIPNFASVQGARRMLMPLEGFRI